jgi:radical SAM-linked protein
MMRLVERLVVRAGLPIRYSQGFNPRPVMSLACPRPVGVASAQEMLVLGVDEEIPPTDMLAKLNSQTPGGMHFDRLELMEGRSAIPKRIDYELELTASEASAVRERIDRLNEMPAWNIQRQTSPRHGRGPMISHDIDLKPMVSAVRLEGALLGFTLTPQGDSWARPAEVLKLLGLDERVHLAACRRTHVQYAMTTKQTG